MLSVSLRSTPLTRLKQSGLFLQARNQLSRNAISSASQHATLALLYLSFLCQIPLCFRIRIHNRQ